MARTRHDIPAILTSLNVNGLAVARALGRNGVPVVAIHGNHTDPETKTKYVDEIWHQEGNLEGLLLHQGPKFAEPPVLLTITDDSVATVAANLDELRRFYRIAMPAPSMVQRLLDKAGFETVVDELTSELTLPLPGTWRIHDDATLAAALAELPFPCIMKPPTKSAALDAAGGKKAYILDDADNVREIYRQFRDVQPEFMLQQYIPGGDDAVYFCLLACGEDHEPLATFTGRKLRQWHPLCGGTSSAEPVDEPELAKLTAAFFRAVGMVGPCSMEFKRDPRDGTFFLIEPTVCRTDWQNAIADANGVPIAYLAYRAALGLPSADGSANSRRWLRRRWVQFGADRLSAHYYRQRGELGRLRWLWSIRPPVRGAYFALDDPSPFLQIFRQTCRRAVEKLTATRRDPS